MTARLITKLLIICRKSWRFTYLTAPKFTQNYSSCLFTSIWSNSIQVSLAWCSTKVVEASLTDHENVQFSVRRHLGIWNYVPYHLTSCVRHFIYYIYIYTGIQRFRVIYSRWPAVVLWYSSGQYPRCAPSHCPIDGMTFALGRHVYTCEQQYWQQFEQLLQWCSIGVCSSLELEHFATFGHTATSLLREYMCVKTMNSFTIIDKCCICLPLIAASLIQKYYCSLSIMSPWKHHSNIIPLKF
jgi:hypothetical protein